MSTPNRKDPISAWWDRTPLSSKITGVTVMLLTLGLLVSGVGTMSVLRTYLFDQVTQQLNGYYKDPNTVLMSDETSSDYFNNSSSQISAKPNFVAIYTINGQLVDNNADELGESAPSVSLDLRYENLLSYSSNKTLIDLQSADGKSSWKAIAKIVITSDQQAYALLIAVPTTSLENLLATYQSVFLLFGLSVIIIGALLTMIIVKSTFTPLREAEETAAAFAAGDFSRRLTDTNSTTEVGRLNTSLNTMLDQIDSAFEQRASTIAQMRRFIGDASHELRTPLVSVRGYAELYRMGALSAPEDVAQAMERIEKEAIRMGALVEDLLELARLDETRPLQVSTVDLASLARDAALDAMAGSPDRVVSVIDDSGSLPPLVLGEENKLRQVITNLMGNAMRFTGHTSPIEIRVASTSDRAIIDIVDHGEGIPEQIRSKIFQRFWRADTSRARETGGSGLGLAIVASIVSAHRGSVDVFETEGGGATFRVSLPLLRTDSEPTRPTRKLGRSSGKQQPPSA